MVNIFTLIL